MAKYIEKLEVVDAEQWSLSEEDVKKLTSEEYRKSNPPLRYAGVVIQLDATGPNIGIGGKVLRPGDYIVTHADGTRTVHTRAQFESQFDSVKD